MSRNLKSRIETLERAIHGPDPITIIIRHICGDGTPPIRALTDVNGQLFERKAEESEDQFTKRAKSLAAVLNGIRMLHQSC